MGGSVDERVGGRVIGWGGGREGEWRRGGVWGRAGGRLTVRPGALLVLEVVVLPEGDGEPEVADLDCNLPVAIRVREE